jgi:hypothetical protein
MHGVYKPSDSERCTAPSEPFRFFMLEIVSIKFGMLRTWLGPLDHWTVQSTCLLPFMEAEGLLLWSEQRGIGSCTETNKST